MRLKFIIYYRFINHFYFIGFCSELAFAQTGKINTQDQEALLEKLGHDTLHLSTLTDKHFTRG